MHGRKNPPRRSRRRRACTTRCARSRPAPHSGRRWTMRSRATQGTQRRQPQPWLVWPRQQPALQRRQRRPCRPGSRPRPTASRRMTPVFRSHTMRRRRSTTTHRSCSTRSCRQRPLSIHRLPMRASWRSTLPHRTRCRIPASTMLRSRIVPTTRSDTPTMRPPRRHRESRPRRRSTRPSTSRRGKTSPASRFPRSTHPAGTRSPSHRRTRRDRNRPMLAPHTPRPRRFMTSPRATRRHRSIPTTQSRRNRLPQSIARHRPACRRASPT
ncbi:hypothetical protein BLA17378_00001 [Burkholderia aenigmatica]|uniref:Uncharacterized protein n=1 Tax=Burkholderia aenigmatica TaxID=2015348 RepID=A0ABY6XNS4_9BURK|nr:hypothetical protein BLA17378_00001 [Burkholderia aenigmatica]VWD30304.1 hypothetical protein BLA18628_04554 [Burkholderia aenigmatica]